MKIVLINGRGGVGKDTFVAFAQEIAKENGFKIMNISTIDVVKEAALILGWDGNKDEKGRAYLSDLKDLATSYCNLSSRYIERKKYEFLEDPNIKVMFVHVREPQEIELLKKRFNAQTLLVTNSRIPLIESNHADRDAENYSYDYIINNEGELKDLGYSAFKYLIDIGLYKLKNL